MNVGDAKNFLHTCEEHRELMQDIFVATPARPHDGLCIALHDKLKWWFREGIESQVLEDSMGGFIEITRTRIAMDFLNRMNHKFLLMIDTDTEPPLNLPYMLARHNEPVVASCIVSMGTSGRPMLCFARQDENGMKRMIDFEDGEKIPATGLAEVPHAGTGAMLIRRDVLESFDWDENHPEDIPFFVPDKIRARGAVNGKMMRGEDIQFCIKAKEKGFKIHVDMEAHCGHRKSMRMIFPPHQRDPSLDPIDWTPPAKGPVFSV